jgi:hypothetical protein
MSITYGARTVKLLGKPRVGVEIAVSTVIYPFEFI